ncbi:hypothetical protein [Streptomonospora alba]|nr:hypothetical protein [Streptomonospora alba]
MALVSGVVLAVFVAAGCTSSNDGPAAPTASPSQAKTSSPPSVADEAMGAYTGLWGAITKQSRSTEPDLTALERYATGQALEYARDNLRGRAEDGVVAKGAPSHSAEIAEIDAEAGTAEIHDCMDSTEWLQHDAETGELIEEKPDEPIHRQVEATVHQNGLTWKVSDLLLGQIGSC